MLGLHGIGLLYVREDLIDRLTLTMPGWRSMRDMWDFHAYEQPYAPEAMRFEGGTPNIVGTLSLVKSIDLFERCGPEAIERHVLRPHRPSLRPLDGGRCGRRVAARQMASLQAS